MTEKELKRLSRGELIELAVDQGDELAAVKEQLESAKTMLNNKALIINEAGSIAEAAFKLNGVFEAAQAASQQYLDSIKSLSERQKTICDQIEKESRIKAEKMLKEAETKAIAMEEDTKLKCEAMVEKAKKEANDYWDALSYKLELFYSEHSGLQELLSIVTGQKEKTDLDVL